MSLRVIRIGAGATLQDGGRPGYRRYGVPPGGAFDQMSLAIGNALLGNSPDAPALEMALVGGVFEAERDLTFSVCGAISSVKCAGLEGTSNASFVARTGDRIEIHPLLQGVRAYLCVPGGFSGQATLEGLSGASVQAGDTLSPATGNGADGHPSKLARAPESLDKEPLRFIAAPAFSELVGELSQVSCTVSLNSDRRGVRLDGLAERDVPELTSEPSCVGAIQLTPSGQLLVIGPDGPTVGGYPKVGYLCEADLSRLGQLRPGEQVRLVAIELGEARRESEEAQTALEARCRMIRLTR